MTRVLRPIVLLLVLTLPAVPACTKYHYVAPPPDVKAALVTDDVLKRVQEFQTFVIDGALSGALPWEPSRVAVQWTVRVATVAKQQPNGWQALAMEGWRQTRGELAKVPAFTKWVGILDLLLGA